MENEETFKTIFTIISGVIIALIASIFIFIASVKAEGQTGIEVESVTLNYIRTTTQNTAHAIWTNNNGLFKNWGRTTFIFTIAIWDYSSTTTTNLPIINNVNIKQGTQRYTCDIGNNNIIYRNTDDNIANIYTINCTVPTNETGIQEIDVYLTNIMQAYNIRSSEFFTGYKDINGAIYNQLLQLNSQTNQTNTKLDNIYASIDQIEGFIFNQTNQIQTSTTQIITAINNIANAITTGNQEIINNQNEIAEQQEENQKICRKEIIDKTKGIENGYLTTNGEIKQPQSELYTTTDYIKILETDKIIGKQGANTDRLCFYNQNKTVINCKERIYNEEITIPEGSYYIRLTILKSTNLPQIEIESCQNGNQAMMDYGENIEPEEPSQEIQEADSEEEALYQSITEIEPVELEIDLDQSSNEFVWNNLTRIIQSHASVFGMFISILVIGIIKTILGR